MKKQKNPLKKISQLSILFLAFFVILAPFSAQARVFNPNNIITDEELFAPGNLSKGAIQVFLDKKNSVLANYTQEIEGSSKKASEIIWEVAQKQSINSKFLLTTLEKEQALLSRSTAPEKTLDWATGFGCYGGTCRDQYKGFYNQLESAAEVQNIYRARAGQFSFRPGHKATTVDGYVVEPQNQATANLYIYTPHVGNAPELGINQPFGANKLFWRIWHRYFSNQPFLDGQSVSHGGTYYLIKNNKKYRYASKEIFLAENSLSEAIAVNSEDLKFYPDGGTIYYPHNSVVRSASSGQYFLIDNFSKRPLLTESALALLNTPFNIAVGTDSIKTVPDEQLAIFPVGTSIADTAIYPQGKLFKDQGGIVWLLKDNLKHLVYPEVMAVNFKGQSAESANNEVINQYPSGEPIKIADGTFVTLSGSYYLISNGERAKISDLSVFDRVFGIAQKNTAVKVSSAVLNLHPATDAIEYMDDTIVDPPTIEPPVDPVIPSGNIYAAEFSAMEPNGLIIMGGQNYKVKVNFKNTGDTTWKKSEVSMSVYDQGKTTSLFNVPPNAAMLEDFVAPGQVGSFETSITAPTNVSGALGQFFVLKHNGIQFAAVGKFIIVKPLGASAEIVSHTLPVAVKNAWGPLAVEMQIKNTSDDTVWLSRKTALEIYNADGTPSVLYDPNDWVRREVAAVPINQTQIKPGETGTFKFTINPKGLTKGTHTMNFKLKLLDKDGKEVYLNGMHQWQRLIRID